MHIEVDLGGGDDCGTHSRASQTAQSGQRSERRKKRKEKKEEKSETKKMSVGRELSGAKRGLESGLTNREEKSIYDGGHAGSRSRAATGCEVHIYTAYRHIDTSTQQIDRYFYMHNR